MFLCTSKFDMEEEQFAFLKEFSSRDEIEAVNEEREDTPDQFDLDPISDNEEQDTKEQRGDEDTQHAIISEQAVISDDEVNLLPAPREELRASVRPRKRVRREDDQFAYY